jgi:phage terminase large subunit GpA-like protein
MNAADHYLSAIQDAIRPDPKVWIDAWAEENRVLPPDTPEPGPWRNSRTPYLIDIMRTMSPGSRFREGWVMKGHQLGGSSAGENFIGASICTAAGSILVVFPTLEDAKQWELTRFEEMRKSTKALRRKVKDSASKGADNTKLRKKFPGGVMRLVGSNRVGALKSSTIRYVKFEEPDEYPLDVGDQGDTITLAKKRTSNFGPKAKIYGDGTPTIDERSVIQREHKRGDQREWRLFCPGGCGEAQPLVWGQFKYPDGDPDGVKYHCRACGLGFAEHEWKGQNYRERPSKDCTEEEARDLGLAHWVGTAQGERGVASWKLPSFIAPIGWRPWVKIAADWIAAQHSEELLKAWWNNEAGECWRDTVRSTVNADALQARAENYPLMTLPQGGLVITAGVDTQDNRLAVVIRGWGRGEESWGIWHGEIYGDPSTPEVWGKLRELLDAPIRHTASGQVVRVDAAFVDAGGHHQEDVFAFTRDAQARGKHWYAIRGAKAYDAPKLGRPKTMEFNWRGRPVPGGAQMRFLGTQSIKNLIDSRLKLTSPGGGYYHNPLGFQADYFKQVRSEKREWRRDGKGNKALWWVPGSERNEAWDCEVYSYGAYLFTMSGRHAESVWRTREKLFASAAQLDLLVQTSVQALTEREPPEQARLERHEGGAMVNTETGEIVNADELHEQPDQDEPPERDQPELLPRDTREQEQRRAPVPSQPKPKPAMKKPPKKGGFVRRWG